MNVNSLFDIGGKTALITGAGTGIGEYLSKGFAAAGATVVCCGRRLDKIENVSDAIKADGNRAIAAQMDVMDEASIRDAFDKAESNSGLVTILINNAGYAGPEGLLNEFPEQEWNTIMDTNVKGVWRVSNEAVNRLISANQHGSIINIASINSFGTRKANGPYSPSKAACLMLTYQQALDWVEFGIRVNAIAPGYFVTEMTEPFFSPEKFDEAVQQLPMGRTGNLEELVGPALLLASDASSYMSGSVITVDGAYSCQLL